MFSNYFHNVCSCTTSTSLLLHLLLLPPCISCLLSHWAFVQFLLIGWLASSMFLGCDKLLRVLLLWLINSEEEDKFKPGCLKSEAKILQFPLLQNPPMVAERSWTRLENYRVGFHQSSQFFPGKFPCLFNKKAWKFLSFFFFLYRQSISSDKNQTVWNCEFCVSLHP